jgi:hypothetical protein
MFNNKKSNGFVNMSFADYNLVIEEKDKIIEKLSNKLDEYTEKHNDLKNSLDKFLNKNNFNNLDEVDLFIDKYKHEEKENTMKVYKIDKTDNTFDNLLNKYYNYELTFIPKCIKNTNINKNIKGINKSINKKDIENANIVYNMFCIYYKYLNNNEKKLNFEEFLEYNKKNYKFIELSTTRIKDKYKRCYDIFPEIINSDNKDIVIIILSRFKLSYSKIYKLKDKHRNKLKMFINYELNKIDFSNICIKHDDFNTKNIKGII